MSRTVFAVIMIAGVALAGCQTTTEMSYSQRQEFLSKIARQCSEEQGASTYQEHRACVEHEMRRYNTGVAARREAGDALLAASARRTVNCTRIGDSVTCY